MKQYGEDSLEGQYEEGGSTALLSMMDIAKFAMTVGGRGWFAGGAGAGDCRRVGELRVVCSRWQCCGL